MKQIVSCEAEGCHGRIMLGATRCRAHATPADLELHARARGVREANRFLGFDGDEAHPVEHILTALKMAARQSVVMGEMVDSLDQRGERAIEQGEAESRGWFGTREYVDPETGDVVERRTMDPLLAPGGSDGVKMHPFVKEYSDSLERRVKFAKLALDAGVEERRTQIAESQALQINTAIRAILTELGVKQDRATIEIVKRELRKLGEGGNDE